MLFRLLPVILAAIFMTPLQSETASAETVKQAFGLNATIKLNDEVVGQPSIVFRKGEPAKVAVQGADGYVLELEIPSNSESLLSDRFGLSGRSDVEFLKASLYVFSSELVDGSRDQWVRIAQPELAISTKGNGTSFRTNVSQQFIRQGAEHPFLEEVEIEFNLVTAVSDEYYDRLNGQGSDPCDDAIGHFQRADHKNADDRYLNSRPIWRL